MKPRSSVGWVGAAVLAVFAVACSNTEQGLKEDAQENAQKAEQAAGEAREKAREADNKAEQAIERAGDATAAAGRAAAEAAGSAGRAAEGAAGTAGRAVDAAQQTAEIKAALIADKSVDAIGIDVDTNGQTMMVMLKGHVPTAAQKTRAGEIATSKAPGYKIDNQIEIRR